MKEESKKILDGLIMEHSNRYARPSGLSDEEYESIDKYDYHSTPIHIRMSIPLATATVIRHNLQHPPPQTTWRCPRRGRQTT